MIGEVCAALGWSDVWPFVGEAIEPTGAPAFGAPACG